MTQTTKTALFGVVLAGLALHASATPVTGTRFAVQLGNELEPNNTYLVQDANVVDPTSVDDSYSRSFEVVTGTFSEGEGDPIEQTETMTLSASGKATSSGGTLKSYVTATVTNPAVADPDDPFVIDTDFNTNPDGVPDAFQARSLANFSDTIQLSADGELDSILVEFAVDGSLTGGGTFAKRTSVIVGQGLRGQYAAGPVDSIFDSGLPGIVDTTVTSDPIAVVNGLAELEFGLFTEVGFDIESLFFNESTATVDFFNTLTIQNVLGFDSQGQQVLVTGATGSDGSQIIPPREPSAAVPAPGTWLLMLAGLAGVGWRRAGAGAGAA